MLAIGQGIDFRKFAEYSGIKIEQGRISALDTSEIEDAKGIFAGGDCVTGPATVIRAIAAGKTAAANIDEDLGYQHELPSDVILPPVRFDDNAPTGRINMRERAAEERGKEYAGHGRYGHSAAGKFYKNISDMRLGIYFLCPMCHSMGKRKVYASRLV